MARGWESKSVADQLDDAERLFEEKLIAKRVLKREVADRIEAVRLSKARILDQLERARNPAHRAMLSAALRQIEIESIELADATRVDNEKAPG